jgi:hypothetical protein
VRADVAPGEHLDDPLRPRAAADVAGELAQADITRLRVIELAGRRAVDAHERDPAEHAAGAEQGGQIVLAAQPILQREDCGLLVQKRPDEPGELGILGRLQRDDHEVDLGHRRRVVVSVNLLGAEREVAADATDAQAVAADVLVIGAQQHVHVMPVLREPPAVIPAERAGTDDRDGGRCGHGRTIA